MRDVFLEGIDILPEGLKAFGSEGAGGAGHLTFETLLDGYVTSRGKLVQLDAEIAGGGSGLLLNVREIS